MALIQTKEVVYLFREKMIRAINSKRLVELTFDANEKGTIERVCVPYDIGPSNRMHDGIVRYHFKDLNSPEGSHPLSIEPRQIKALELKNETFNPADHITWTPNWYYPRDWGRYS
jgi:hypothetical protein